MPNSGISIPNAFASASGNVPASQLDSNFNALAAQANALASASNYFVDSGSANAIVITVGNPLTAAYAAGLPLQIKVAANNTGATTINMNSLGAVPLIYPSGSGMASGQLQAGAIISVMYDGANFQYLGSQLTPTGTGGSFTATLTGMSGTTTGTLYYVISNGIASIYATGGGGITGTSNAATFTITGLPAALQTTNVVGCACTAIDNSGGRMAYASISGSGSGTIIMEILTVSGSVIVPSSPGWTNSGVKGLPGGWTVTYPLS